jgi:hypothetical protein
VFGFAFVVCRETDRRRRDTRLAMHMVHGLVGAVWHRQSLHFLGVQYVLRSLAVPVVIHHVDRFEHFD